MTPSTQPSPAVSGKLADTPPRLLPTATVEFIPCPLLPGAGRASGVSRARPAEGQSGPAGVAKVHVGLVPAIRCRLSPRNGSDRKTRRPGRPARASPVTAPPGGDRWAGAVWIGVGQQLFEKDRPAAVWRPAASRISWKSGVDCWPGPPTGRLSTGGRA
jgi:hypothetical protein